MKFFKSKQHDTQVDETPIKPEQPVTPEPATPPVAAPVEAPKATVATPETLMKRLTEIAAEYNRSREQLQQQLFTHLDQLTAAQQADEATLKQVAQEQKEVEAEVQRLQVVDTGEEDALLAKKAEKIAELEDSQEQQDAIVKAADEKLASLGDQRESLTKQLEALKEDSQALTDRFRAETDPLAILNMADAMRTQVEKNATKQKQLEAELEEVETQYTEQDQDLKTQAAKLADLKAALESQHEAQTKIQDRRARLVNERADAAAAAQEKLKTLGDKQHTVEANVAERKQQLQAARQQMQEWFGSTHRVNTLDLDDGTFVFALDTFLPKRANELAQIVQYLLKAGVEKVGLYSAYFDINLQQEIDAWAAQYEIDGQKLQVINPLLQLQATDSSVAQTPIQLPKTANQTWNADHSELILQMNDVKRRLKVRYYQDLPKQISDITYLDGEQMHKHSFFDRQGHLLANVLFDDRGILKEEAYYRQDGILVMTISYAQGNQQNVELFDKNGVLQRDFTDTAALTQWWLNDAFTANTRFVGCFNHPDYALFLKNANVEAVPYLTAADTTEPNFADAVKQTDAAAFIVANYPVAQGLVQVLDRDVALLQLNNVNLPFQIGSPVAN